MRCDDISAGDQVKIRTGAAIHKTIAFGGAETTEACGNCPACTVWLKARVGSYVSWIDDNGDTVSTHILNVYRIY